MAFVPGFEQDVFVICALADDSRESAGWVTRFRESLSRRLATMLGARADVFLDRKPAGADASGDAARVRRAATLVAVLSEHFLHSPACVEALRTFAAADTEGRRVFAVSVTELTRKKLPAPVADLQEFRFFSRESGDRSAVRFRNTSEGDDRYWVALDDLSQDIAKTLRSMLQDTAAREEAHERIVYLAETSADVNEDRERIRRALIQQGVTVLPRTRLPQTGALREAASHDLRRAAVSVHILGPEDAEIPVDGTLSLPHMQVEAAADVARETRLRRIVWVSPGANGFEEHARRQLLRWIETRQAPDELLQAGLEELKAVVFESLPPAPLSPAASPPPMPPVLRPDVPPPPVHTEPRSSEVFVSYSRADAAPFALTLSEVLRDRGVRVWIDVKDIRAGANFRRAIEEALHRCTQMLVILSPRAVESDEVMGEANVALDERKTVVPILYLPCRVPSYLRVRQHIDFTGLEPTNETAVNAVLAALRGVAAEAS